MLDKSSRWTIVRRFLTTALFVPALMVTVAPPAWTQGSANAVSAAASAPGVNRCRRVPENGFLATVGLALAVIASAAVYRRRRT